MSIALFKVVRNEDFKENDNGLSFTGQLIPATPEEIKACHPTCNSCEAFDGVCYNEESACFTYEMNPDSSYCNHHEPKE